MSQTTKTCCNRISLNEGITYKNYIGCLAHYFMLSFVFVSVDSLQPMLFQQKYNIHKDQQIQNFKNALVITFDIAVKLLCAPIFGYLADRYGRKRVNLYGIMCISVSMFAMPYAPEYWVYAIIRCFYATGAIAISVIPLLADYVDHKSRGTCAAILVFMSSLGALASAFINFTILDKLSNQYKIYVQYGVISILILIIGLTYIQLCLKSGNSYYNRDNRRRNFQELCAVAKQTFKSPEITTGYISAFLARGDSILLSLYLVLWTYSFDTEHNDDKFDEASKKSSMLSGIAYTIIMLSCIIYGFLYERKNLQRRNLMVFMLLLAMTGSLMINFANSVDSFFTYFSLGVLGLGMSGLLTSSLFLVNQYSAPEHRGFITGIQTFFGVIGITFQTIIGALLYEFVSRNGPFNYFAGTCLLATITTILVYRYSKKYSTKESLLHAEVDSLEPSQSLATINDSGSPQEKDKSHQ